MTARPLRIGIVVEYLTARGGTTRLALEWAHEARRRGHAVTLFTTQLDRARCYPHLLEGLDVISLRELAAAPALRVEREAGERLARRAARFAGLHHLAGLPLLRNQTRALTELLLLHRERFDCLNPHDFGPAMWASVQASRKTGAPVVWQCNDPIAKWTALEPSPAAELERLAQEPARQALVRIERSFARDVGETLVLDTRVAREVFDRYGLQPRVVRGALDATHFAVDRSPAHKRALRAKLGLPDDAVVVASVTLLHPWRRLEDSIEAFSTLDDPRAFLYVAAPAVEGSYTDLVREAIARSPARSRIVWRDTPFANEAELLEVYAAADVFVFPNAQQTWGLAVLEAAASGLALVVSRGAGASEVLTDGADALLHDPLDVVGLRDAMRRLIGDAALRERLGLAAAETARRHDWARYGEAVERACRRLLDGTSSARDRRLPPDARILPYAVPLAIPSFGDEGKGSNILAPDALACDRWYNDFVDRLVDALGRRFLPVTRMSDGEFHFCFGDRPPLSTEPLARRLAETALQQLHGLGREGFTARTVGRYSSGSYSADEWKNARDVYARNLVGLARDGLLALHLSYGDRTFQERYFPALGRWLFELGVELTLENYAPFYFVYAALTGPRRSELLKGRRILVVNGATGAKQQAIVRGLEREGASEVRWLGISADRSLFDRVDPTEHVGRVDLAVVGAGIGKPNVLPQLAPLGVPCVDAGFVFEVWADPAAARERPFCKPMGS